MILGDGLYLVYIDIRSFVHLIETTHIKLDER